VFDQLLLSGVLEAVKIRQQGYSSRITYNEFVTRYRCVATVFAKEDANEIFKVEQEDAVVARKLVEVFLGIAKPALSSADFAYGKTKVFYRHLALQTLELARQSALKDITRQFQRLWRGYKAAKKLALMRRIQSDLKAWLRETTLFGDKSTALKGAPAAGRKEGVRYTTSDLTASVIAKLGSVEAVVKQMTQVTAILTKAERSGVRNALVSEAMCMRTRMQQEVSCNQELGELQASMDPIAIEKTLARAKSMGLPPSEIVQNLERRTEKLSEQLPLVRGLKLALSKDLKEPKDLDQARNTMTSVEKAGLRKSPEEWLPELDGAKLAADLEKILPAKEEEKPQKPPPAKEKPEKAPAAKDKPEKPAPTKEKVEKASSTKDDTLKVPSAGDVKKRVTITGLAEHEETQLVQDLISATEEYDAEKLQELLGEAVKNGLPNSDTADARQRLENMQSTPFVLEAMREAEASVNMSLAQSKAPPASAVKILQKSCCPRCM